MATIERRRITRCNCTMCESIASEVRERAEVSRLRREYRELREIIDPFILGLRYDPRTGDDSLDHNSVVRWLNDTMSLATLDRLRRGS